MPKINIAVFNYPFALKSAVFGFEELFQLANRACRESELETEFKAHIIDACNMPPRQFDVVLLPPSIDDQFYRKPDAPVLEWLVEQHRRGSVIASACAGAFILAASRIGGQRALTTHWGLAETFKSQYPLQPMEINQILIDHGDVITAGGMMSWLDLGLELVSRYASPQIMRQLGKMLVIDTAPREQRFYQQFTPSFSHGDIAIVESQHRISACFSRTVSVKQLAVEANLTERTFQRRFVKATGMNPNQYLQRVRVQKACDYLEGSTHSFEWISHQVGYENASACRRVFSQIMGLTPGEFRRRFRR
ncbi:helix-turn-helix domain-containing protein [Vibrio sp. Isolate23]|uniref:GlxA family transcriptional regulator n=1 Tax=Vibrio sp. Isolate23 TaxID=2908533 RepID=UPI001EFDB15D|nr:helix-turn-helix domain-containing protein [Vibrio sp. Isolate23]MCG9681752.1 helix-turn-helix domain-containing protein [Vibrio sp. Isolate23]